jgi:dihydrofolate synthase/folylpolyglutamate synthase
MPAIDVLVATSPQVLAKEVKRAHSLADHARREGFSGEIEIESDPVAAVEHARAIADPARGDAILVTGSLYLVGNVRDRWFKEDDIVIARTSWPERSQTTPGEAKDPIHDHA